MTSKTDDYIASASAPLKTPSGPVGNIISAILVVAMIVAMAWIGSYGGRPGSKFNDTVAKSYQRGVDHMFEKTNDGRGVAVNVVLDTGWERTPLLENSQVDQDRYVVARFVYPQVEFSGEGAEVMMGQLNKDINNLIAGNQTANFQGFSTTSPFSVAGNNMAKMGVLPWGMAWGFVFLASLMLLLGALGLPPLKNPGEIIRKPPSPRGPASKW